MSIMGPSLSFRLAGVVVRCPIVTPIVIAVLLHGFGADHLLSFAYALPLVAGAIAMHELARVRAFAAFGVSTRRIELAIAGGSPWLDDLANRPVAEAAGGTAGLLAIALAAGMALFARSLLDRDGTLGEALDAIVPLLSAVAVVQALPALPLD